MIVKQKIDTEKKRPLVSIGVPVYNGEKYLEECLESILNQTYDQWECVICNNSSTDRTPAIAEKYVKKDSRFKLLHTSELLSVTANWNFCFSYIDDASDYFKILPADDWLFPNFISEMVFLMEAHPEIDLCSSYRMVNRRVVGEGLDFYEGNVFNGKEILTKELKHELNITSAVNAILYRVDALKELDYYPLIFQEESFHIDTYLSYELLIKSNLGFVFQVLSYTRRHEDTITSNVSDRLNTTLYFREFSLHKYKILDASLEKEYDRTRLRYAYFLLKSRFLSWNDTLDWHNDRLKRRIQFKEYLLAVIKRIIGKRL